MREIALILKQILPTNFVKKIKSQFSLNNMNTSS